jgi:hypothetical protein
MRVQVRPINVNGSPQFRTERERRSVFAGELQVTEERRDEFGRHVLIARVIDTIDPARPSVLELFDASLIWAHEARLRLRGFEVVGKTQYAQTWDVEIG